MAWDMPEKVDKFVVVDIIPTDKMFAGFSDVNGGLRGYHWLFLSQPEPFPETLIGSANHGRYFLEHTLAA